MAKYQWKQGTNVLAIDFEDSNYPVVEVDLADLHETVQDAAMRFGLKTALRNATAGKMDDLAEAYKALCAKAAVFKSGVWAEEREGAEKPSLSDEDKARIIASMIVKAKQARGDKRTADQIMTAFAALDEVAQKAAIASMQKAIDKRFKAELRDRKAAKKLDAGNW